LDGPSVRLIRLFRALDLGRAFEWQAEAGSGLRVLIGRNEFENREAFARLVIYQPTLYLMFFALAAFAQSDQRWAAIVAFAVVGYVVFDTIRKRLGFAPRLQVET